MVKVLSIVLLLLLLLIGGKRGFKSFLTIYLNLILIIMIVLLCGWGFNPLIVTLLISSIIILLVLFYLNGINKKTICSLVSVMIVIIVFLLLTIIINNRIYIQGYAEENIESIGYVVYDTGLDMMKMATSIVLIGLIGNVIDTSIAISSALYEVHTNNPKLSSKELFKSGMNIGKDILGTTTNTLFFAYLGSCMTLFIYFQDYKYSFETIINSKIFAIEFTRIMISGLASFVVIPITAIITAMVCKREVNNGEKIKNNI